MGLALSLRGTAIYRIGKSRLEKVLKRGQHKRLVWNSTRRELCDRQRKGTGAVKTAQGKLRLLSSSLCFPTDQQGDPGKHFPGHPYSPRNGAMPALPVPRASGNIECNHA